MKRFIVLGLSGIIYAIFAVANINSIFAQELKGELVSFNYGLSATDYKSGYNYTAKLKNDELFVHMYYYTSKGIVEKKRAVNGDTKFLQGLDSLIKEQKLYKWNGFRKTDEHILDGEGFSFSATYRNDKEMESIKASGSNAFPKDFWKASEVVGKYFKENVDKLPTVKANYAYYEVKPEIMTALEYMQEQGIIKNTAGGEVFNFSAKGDTDLAIITIDVAMDPGHSFQVLVRNHTLLALKVVAADGKNITPKYAVINDSGKLQPTEEETYSSMILRKEL